MPAGAADAGEGRDAASWRCRGRQCCYLGRTVPPQNPPLRDASVAEKSVP